MAEKYVQICPKCGSDKSRVTLENIDKRECLECGTVDFSAAFVEVPLSQAHHYQKDSFTRKLSALKRSTSVQKSKSKRKPRRLKQILDKSITAFILLAVVGLLLFLFL